MPFARDRRPPHLSVLARLSRYRVQRIGFNIRNGGIREALNDPRPRR